MVYFRFEKEKLERELSFFTAFSFIVLAKSKAYLIFIHSSFLSFTFAFLALRQFPGWGGGDGSSKLSLSTRAFSDFRFSFVFYQFFYEENESSTLSLSHSFFSFCASRGFSTKN